MLSFQTRHKCHWKYSSTEIECTSKKISDTQSVPDKDFFILEQKENDSNCKFPEKKKGWKQDFCALW